MVFTKLLKTNFTKITKIGLGSLNSNLTLEYITIIGFLIEIEYLIIKITVIKYFGLNLADGFFIFFIF